jgi:16S rRNA (adenine1518-N6/adenine1519-N6)-dimethyltransferase
MDNKIPDKIKEQHIIVDESAISKIVNAASLTEHDGVLEIGGGPGNLTKAIAAHAGQVYAIEKDPGYVLELKKIFSGNHKVMVIEGNALDAKLPQFNKIVSNPPYKILQPFFLRLLHERRYNFECCVTVAPYGFSKLALAKPGSLDFGVMSAFFYAFYNVEVIAELKKNAFKPEPRVTSSILKISPKSNQSPLSLMLKLMFLEDSRKIGNAMLGALWNNGESILQNKVTKAEARRIMDKFENGEQKKQILEKRVFQLGNEEMASLAESILANISNA